MCDVIDVFVRACSDCCAFAERLYAVLDAEEITYSSDCIDGAKSVLVTVPEKGMIAASSVADIMTAVAAGVPVVSASEDTVDEAVAKIKALVGKIPATEEPIIETPAIEVPAVEIPVNSAPKCAVCGTEILPDTKFCYGCGNKIEPAKEEIPEPVKEEKAVCPGCGADIIPNTKFCYGCGRKIEDTPVVEEVKPVCSVCGADIVPGTIFCFNCGIRHEGAPAVNEEPAVPATPKCPGCGADIIEGDKFCFSCGRAL